MKKQDFYLATGIFIICGIYYYMTMQLAEKAAIYPTFVAGLLLFLDILFVVETYISGKKKGKGTTESHATLKDFQFKQFIFVISTACIYVMLINILGFHTTSVIYLIITLLGLKAKKLETIIATVGFAVVVYLAFTMFLKVPLPKGFII